MFLSDHLLVYCSRKRPKQHYEYSNFEGRSYRNYNRDQLQTYLNDVDWQLYWTLINPNDCWKFLLDKLTSCLDNMCPIKMRKNCVNNNPWLTEEILVSIREKNRDWKTAKRTKNPVDLANAKRLRNHCKTIIRRAKGNFVQDYLVDDVISMNKFWEKINYLLPSSNLGNSIQLINKQNFVNDFFTNIGPDLAKEFDQPWQDKMKHYSNVKNDCE